MPNELGLGGRGARTGRGVGCGRADVFAEVVLVAVGVFVFGAATVLDVAVEVFAVFPVVVGLAGVAIRPDDLAGGVLVEVADLGVALVVLVVPVDLLPLPTGVFVVDVGLAVEVREDTAAALPVVFFVESLDGVWATVFVVVVDFLPVAGLEVE
ncbi:MAG: hypothetical protein HY862_11490, partial [Chloroflexi bacterium]|nr:hypothetical protein [Chloroflexota bacterium]